MFAQFNSLLRQDGIEFHDDNRVIHIDHTVAHLQVFTTAALPLEVDGFAPRKSLTLASACRSKRGESGESETVCGV
jgi:hypothetical protein